MTTTLDLVDRIDAWCDDFSDAYPIVARELLYETLAEMWRLQAEVRRLQAEVRRLSEMAR